MQKNLDQSCLMAAEDFAFSVDYWFPQRIQDADEQQQRQKHQQRRRIEQN